jgi:long-chain acyl-CoA synthetase
MTATLGTAADGARSSDALTPVLRLREHARRTPDEVALREKLLGLWRDITWAEYWDATQDVGCALLALGIEPGDRVAVHSENRPEWVYADFGTQAVRGVCVGFYPTNPAAEVQYLLQDSGTRILIAEDQEQVDKVLEIDASELPALEHIVYIEPRGVSHYDDPRLMSWTDFVELGREHRRTHEEELAATYTAAEPDDVVVMIYTSGTTGPPKGAMISIRNIEFAIEISNSNGGIIDPPAGPEDVYVSYLPLCHVFERLLTCWLMMSAGAAVHFAESIQTVQADLRAVQPTLFASVPRILEKMHAGVNVRMSAASRIKRANYAFWSKQAASIGATLKETGGVHTTASRAKLAVGEVFLFRALKERLGLRHCRLAISGAAPIAPEILEWFLGIGVPMVEAYGMTETSAIATSNNLGDIKLGTVGTPLEEGHVRLDEETGEILIRHGGVFAGYWNKPEKTAETIDEDGWLHTGDVGEWDGRHLRIVDRLKDIIITSGGKNISPSEIENSLKTSPFVKEAIVIGDGRKYLSALIGIEDEVVGHWAQQRGLAYTTYRDLSEKPEVVELIRREVDATNEKFASVEQIKQFRLLPKVLDEDDGEVTATQKVKRSAIADIFADLIESMYSSPRSEAS